MSQNLRCQDGNEYFSQFKLSMGHSKVRGAGHQTEELSHKNAMTHGLFMIFSRNVTLGKSKCHKIQSDKAPGVICFCLECPWSRTKFVGQVASVIFWNARAVTTPQGWAYRSISTVSYSVNCTRWLHSLSAFRLQRGLRGVLAWLKKNTRVGVPLREHGQSRIRKHALIWVGPGAGDTLVRPIQKFMLGFRIPLSFA